MIHKRSPIPKPTVRHPDRKKEAERVACRGVAALLDSVGIVGDDAAKISKGIMQTCEDMATTEQDWPRINEAVKRAAETYSDICALTAAKNALIGGASNGRRNRR